MGSFKIQGGHQLHGEIIPQGAKNEALQVICGVLLTSEPVTISNIPQIRDVIRLIQLLEDLGVKVDHLSANDYRFTSDNVNLSYLETESYKEQAGALRRPRPVAQQRIGAWAACRRGVSSCCQYSALALQQKIARQHCYWLSQTTPT